MRLKMINNSWYEEPKTAYGDRKFLYIFPHAAETYCVVNYDADNVVLNTFLAMFDVWRSKGQMKVSQDSCRHNEVWFEVDKEFFQLAKTSRTFQRAIERTGVKIVFEYPFQTRSDEWLKAFEMSTKMMGMLRESERVGLQFTFGQED